MKFEEQVYKLATYQFSKDFVAISTEVDDAMFCIHSGLIISFDEKIYYFHFAGSSVELVDITSEIQEYKNVYFKKLEIIVEDDVVSFLGHCEKLNKNGLHPLYGFVFNNSYYDSSNTYYLKNAKHDITTCVGFCIKIIRGFIYNNPEYIKIDDWTATSVKDVKQWLWNYIEKYLTIYANQNGLTVSELFSNDELKRILPSELLSSTYFKTLPITKSEIDRIRPNLEKYIISLKVA